MNKLWMNKVWESKMKSPTDRMVALAIAYHCDEDGKCWLGVSQIASYTLLARSTIQRVIRRLEKAGFLVVGINAGEFRTNQYQLRIDENGEAAHTQQPVGN